MQKTKSNLVCLITTLVIFNASASQTIVIDGNVESTEWQHAQVFERYIQSFPNTGEKPKYPTTTY